MVDYDFYRNAYLGSRISEKAFPEAEAKAVAFLCIPLDKFNTS